MHNSTESSIARTGNEPEVVAAPEVPKEVTIGQHHFFVFEAQDLDARPVKGEDFQGDIDAILGECRYRKLKFLSANVRTGLRTQYRDPKRPTKDTVESVTQYRYYIVKCMAPKA